MFTTVTRFFFLSMLLMSFNNHAGNDDLGEAPYKEMSFVKAFSGKSADYVVEKLGEPDNKVIKENAGGTVEFWLYSQMVRQGNSDKIYKYTQIGIVNNNVETLGNTNRAPQ